MSLCVKGRKRLEEGKDGRDEENKEENGGEGCRGGSMKSVEMEE